MQSVAAINESGVYKIALKSQKPAAKRFVKWLTSVVLPSLRRTGQFGAPATPIDLTDPTQLQGLLQQLASIALAADTKIAELEPQADALARLTEADGALCITDAAKLLGVQPRRLFSWLEANHWTYRRSDGGHWVSYQTKLTSGMLEHKSMTIARRGGMPGRLVEQVMVTPKGLARLATLKAGQ